jgi:hypothetical protein
MYRTCITDVRPALAHVQCGEPEGRAGPASGGKLIRYACRGAR